jgi:hypothetical protein
MGWSGGVPQVVVAGAKGGHRWATLLLSRETALPMYTCAFPIDSLIKYLQQEAAIRRQPSEL